MAITKVRVKINNVWTNLSYKSNTGKWNASLTAPAITSFNLPNKYYPVLVEITNDAGTVATYDYNNAQFGKQLRLIVKEKVKPIIRLTYPTDGALITNNSPRITFNITDETNGSGINLGTVSIVLDSTTYKVSSPELIESTIQNGYSFTLNLGKALSDGSHTIKINSKDNDGNSATQVSGTFVIDTVAPTLTVSKPFNGFITNEKTLNVTGTTNDNTSSPVKIKIVLNGTDTGAVTVEGNGNFTKAITLAEGNNTIVITATDRAGKSTSVTRTVKLDTTVPKITSVEISPNPVDANNSVVVTLGVI